MSPLLYVVTLLMINLSFIQIFHLSFCYTKENPTLEDHSYRSINNAPISIYPKEIQVTLSEQNRPQPKHLFKIVKNNKTLKLNITSYFLNILDSPYVSARFATGVTITKTNWPNKTSSKDSIK